MKKIFLFLSLSIGFFGCKNEPDTSSNPITSDIDTLTLEERKNYTEYSEAYVIEMQKFYYKQPMNINNIPGTIPLDNPPIRKILKGQDRLKIIIGAYLRDTLGESKGHYAIIVQLKEKGSGKKVYYDLKAINFNYKTVTYGSAVCPLPEPPCSLE